ncbi:LuxR family transcriptional regulator [Paenibacillus beijingensis]|uniref:LuxR family transcriptional regulator n=2 Tax=Paenibacillus beijingensis TaxID=1126833 RepID=A0A0D5NSJ9_9BACL|nr:LuxR family transcriptional regulator [Paenibacillus beijingensis]
MVRKGLQVFLNTQSDMELVGEASNGLETLDKAAALQPDVILMDLNMPGLNGIEATKQIKAAFPNVKVIVLTSFSDQDHVLPAIRAGAKGYLLKDVEPEELARAIRRVYQGQVELHPEAAGQLMDLIAEAEPPKPPERNPDLLAELTKREQEVLRLIASGKSNKEIAEILVITEKTVKTHVSHVLNKLGMADRTQAAIYAIKYGQGG